MNINFEKFIPIVNKTSYENDELRSLIPSIFKSKKDKKTTFYQVKREPVDNKPY